MIDDDLLKEIEEVSRIIGDIHMLPIIEATSFIKEIEEKFVSDGSKRWWWTSLLNENIRLSYKEDGLSILETLVTSAGQLRLVVTDDSDPPWPVYEGKFEKLLELLKGCRFFEYFVAPGDVSWVIFDVHTNELVVAGNPPLS
jgi:hypothetical protein